MRFVLFRVLLDVGVDAADALPDHGHRPRELLLRHLVQVHPPRSKFPKRDLVNKVKPFTFNRCTRTQTLKARASRRDDVGAVGEAEGAQGGPHLREARVLADAVGAVDLHGLVDLQAATDVVWHRRARTNCRARPPADHLQGHARRRDLPCSFGSEVRPWRGALIMAMYFRAAAKPFSSAMTAAR